MAFLMLSWLVIAFLLALFARALVPNDVNDVEADVVLGTLSALAISSFANELVGEPIYEPHPAGLAGAFTGALAGVTMAARRERRASIR
jgi:hypothetical protein